MLPQAVPVSLLAILITGNESLHLLLLLLVYCFRNANTQQLEKNIKKLCIGDLEYWSHLFVRHFVALNILGIPQRTNTDIRYISYPIHIPFP